MTKTVHVLIALALVGCAPAEAPPAPAPETFLTQLQTDYPATLSPIAEGVWVHTTNYNLPGQAPIPSNGLVVVDGEAVTLIDGAWGELATLALIEKVEAETGKPVTKMVVTHHHADRTMGVDVAERRGIEIYTHPNTPTLAAEAGWPVPNTSVAALKAPKSRSKLGRVEIAYPGPGHAPDNLVAYLPDVKVLYAGCAVRGADTKTLGNIEDAELKTWADSLAWTKATYPDATLVVPGHGKGANLSLIDATLAMIKTADTPATP